MVGRRFNQPVGSVMGAATFWLMQPGTSWQCRACLQRCEGGTCCLQLFQRFDKGLVVKYVCLGCAEKLLEDAMDKVKLLKQHGPDGYMLFKEA
jgi:hypothetical protein